MKHMEKYLETIGLRYLQTVSWNRAYDYGKESVEKIDTLTRNEKEKLLELFFWKMGTLAIADVEKFTQKFGIDFELTTCLYAEEKLGNEVYLHYSYEGGNREGSIKAYGYVGWIEELGLQNKDKLIEKTEDVFPEFKLMCIFDSEKAIDALFNKVDDHVNIFCDEVEKSSIGEELLNNVLFEIQEDFEDEKKRRKGVSSR